MDEKAGYKKTFRRVLSKRGVVWLGQTCNLRCHFCYFQSRIEAKDHPEHAFMSLDKAKTICSTLAGHYGNRAIDIQGGEPTIYPQIHELCEHCREIGLLPTLITNALVLHKKEACQRLASSGVRDLLISVHGLGDSYDKAVGVKGAHAKQMQALDNLIEIGLPFRFNCVLAKSVLPDLPKVAELAIQSGARVLNFITFNPFEDQQKNQRSRENVPTYEEVAGPLARAMDALIAADVEVNVRYFPFCMLPEKYRKHFYNFQQLPYDLHEWDYASWSWTAEPAQRRAEGGVSPLISLREANARAKMFREWENYLADQDVSREDEYRHSGMLRAREHCKYQYSAGCGRCALFNICDGFNGDYASLFGASEARPIEGPQTDDPCLLIREQSKIVEPQDYAWAL